MKVGEIIDEVGPEMQTLAAKLQKFFPGRNLMNIWRQVQTCESIRNEEYDPDTLYKLVENYFEIECPEVPRLGHGERHKLWDAPTGLMGMTVAGQDIIVGSYNFHPRFKDNYIWLSDHDFADKDVIATIPIPVNEAAYMPYIDPKTGILWVAGENDGEVFRVPMQGKPVRVWQGKGGIHGGAFAVHRSQVDGKLWGLSGGEIKNLEGSTQYRFEGFYGKSFCELSYAHDPGEGPKLYVPGWFAEENTNGYLVYGDGRKWREGTSRTSGRFNYGFNNRSRTWILLCGTSNYSGGEHHRNSAALWAKNKGGHFRISIDSRGLDYASSGCFINERQAVIGTTTTWKSNRLGARLFSVDCHTRVTKPLGDPFPDAEIRSVCWDASRERLLVSTKTQNKGRIYEVGIEV